MSNGRDGILVPSTNRGRYALDTADDSMELTSGQACEVWLGGQWMGGRIEHGGGLYATGDATTPSRGYYVQFTDGGICGLCVGMRVRVGT
jgi:Domain of unknown function (DUF5348)